MSLILTPLDALSELSELKGWGTELEANLVNLRAVDRREGAEDVGDPHGPGELIEASTANLSRQSDL